MSSIANETILLIGDVGREIRSALLGSISPGHITAVPTVFDGIAELTRRGGLPTTPDAPPVDEEHARFTTILAAVDPIERRPEAAVKTLRDLAGNSRLVLFGLPAHEGLSQKMLKFGCDDYLVTPVAAAELRETLSSPNPRVAMSKPIEINEPPIEIATSAHGSDKVDQGAEASSASPVVTPTGEVDLTAVSNSLLDGLLQSPHDPVGWALKLLNARLKPMVELFYRRPGEAPVEAVPDRDLISYPVATPEGPGGTLFAAYSYDADERAIRELLVPLAAPIGKVVALSARHATLQKMAITDELTGVYNARYFRHFLQRILEKARQMHFPVTLLLFDLDDFKRYNDSYGHQVGDEILRQTAAMMKRCTREHDLVARIGGDEFAVVFWDKEGPRQPREPRSSSNISRPPQSPVQVFERFQRMIQSDEFTALGSHGRGKLGISAGLAVYPYEGHNVETLIAEADRAMMQGAKRQGKNCLALVGNANGAHHSNGQA